LLKIDGERQSPVDLWRHSTILQYSSRPFFRCMLYIIWVILLLGMNRPPGPLLIRILHAFRRELPSRADLPFFFSFFLFCFSVYIFKIVVGSSFSETYDSARCRSVPIHHEYNSKRRRTEEETFISICYDSALDPPRRALPTQHLFAHHHAFLFIITLLWSLSDCINTPLVWLIRFFSWSFK